MIGRFAQLFLLASVVLLLPTMFYLSRQQQPYSLAKDYALMQTQKTQGEGPPPALDPKIAQSWKWTNPWEGWTNLLPAGMAPGEKGGKSEGEGKKGEAKGAIMPKMDDATAKAELGRATWKFLHTMTLRFPDKPTDSDRQTLLRFFQDFSALYPCGECATHFQQLMKEMPPQTSSRMASALWLCMAHNKVNARLGKAEFPCDKLDETYDCGCGPDSKKATAPAPEKGAQSGEGGKANLAHQ